MKKKILKIKGVMKSNHGKKATTWFRLYAKKEEANSISNGWWFYRGYESSHQIKFTIHSKIKNSKSEKGFLVQDNDCWSNKLSKLINSTKKIKIIKAQVFNKGLLSNPYHKVRTIGTLAIID